MALLHMKISSIIIKSTNSAHEDSYIMSSVALKSCVKSEKVIMRMSGLEHRMCKCAIRHSTDTNLVCAAKIMMEIRIFCISDFLQLCNHICSRRKNNLMHRRNDQKMGEAG